MSEDLKKGLIEFLKLVRKTLSPKSSLILFGSYAKGKQKGWSDIDVAVIVPKIKNRFEMEVALRLKALTIDERITPIIFTQKELEENSPLTWEIRQHGRPLTITS